MSPNNKSMTTTAALSMEALKDINAQIQKTLSECSVEATKSMPAIEKAAALSNGVLAMRAALTDAVMNQIFMPLMGSKLGFRTDRDNSDKPPYTIAVVRECIIEAMMRGFMPVGNEFNIIADSFYATKEGFMRKCPEIDMDPRTGEHAVTDIKHQPGVPNMNDTAAVVPYILTWKYKGQEMRIERLFRQKKNDKGEVIETFDERIAVRVNKGQGPDAVLGKAKRKILAQMFDMMTGSSLSDQEPPDLDAITTTGVSVPDKPANEQKIDELVNKHKKNGAAKSETPADESKGDPAADSSGFAAPGSNG